MSLPALAMPRLWWRCSSESPMLEAALAATLVATSCLALAAKAELPAAACSLSLDARISGTLVMTKPLPPRVAALPGLGFSGGRTCAGLCCERFTAQLCAISAQFAADSQQLVSTTVCMHTQACGRNLERAHDVQLGEQAGVRQAQVVQVRGRPRLTPM